MLGESEKEGNVNHENFIILQSLSSYLNWIWYATKSGKVKAVRVTQDQEEQSRLIILFKEQGRGLKKVVKRHS